MKRSLIVFLALCCGSLALLAASIAIAHTVKHPTELTFHLHENGADPDSFAGKVKCEAHRTVEVYRRLGPNGPDPAHDPVLGAAHTDADGHYKVVLEDEVVEGGEYYGLAKRTTLLFEGEHSHVCRNARAGLIVLGSPTG
jgi:hypothetical protein